MDILFTILLTLILYAIFGIAFLKIIFNKFKNQKLKYRMSLILTFILSFCIINFFIKDKIYELNAKLKAQKNFVLEQKQILIKK